MGKNGQSPEFLAYKGKINSIRANVVKTKPEVYIESGKRGGKIGAERKKLKDILQSILDEKIVYKDIEMTREQKLCYEFLGDGNKAKVFEVVRDTKGEKPIDKIEVKSDVAPEKAVEFTNKILKPNDK